MGQSCRSLLLRCRVVSSFSLFFGAKLTSQRVSFSRYQYLDQQYCHFKRFRIPFPPMAQYQARSIHHFLPWWMGYLSLADSKIGTESDYLLVGIRYRSRSSALHHGEYQSSRLWWNEELMIDHRLLPHPKEAATRPHALPERGYLQVQRRSQLASRRLAPNCHSYQSPRSRQCHRQGY
jgi:hypothetical protein